VFVNIKRYLLVRVCARGWSKTRRVRLAALRWATYRAASELPTTTYHRYQPSSRYPTPDATVPAEPTDFTSTVIYYHSVWNVLLKIRCFRGC